MSYSDFISHCKSTSKGTNFSKNEMVNQATAMINDVDLGITTYIKKGDKYDTKVVYPGKSIRDTVIAPILKSFGVDRAEMGKLDTMAISRAGGEALTDFALLLVKEYISTKGLGRKLTLPMTSPEETVQSICTVKSPKEERATTMIAKAEDGTYYTTPTGKVVTTAEHEKVKVLNRVPSWLKDTKTAKK